MKKSIHLFSFVIFFTTFASSQKSINVLANSDNLPLSTITMEKANEIFAEMNTSSLFNMADCNNCEDRANAIGYILKKRGLNVAKFWLFGEGKISTSSQVFLLRSAKCGTWGYHIAIGLRLDNNGTIDTVIIDPATQETAITLRNWALPLIQKDRTGYLAIKDIKYYTYPVSNNKFQADQMWTATDDDFRKTACGLCGLKPRQCGKDRFAQRIRIKQLQLQNAK